MVKKDNENTGADYHIDVLANGYCYPPQLLLPFIMRFGQEWHDNASIMRGMPTVSLKSSATYREQKLPTNSLTQVHWVPY